MYKGEGYGMGVLVVVGATMRVVQCAVAVAAVRLPLICFEHSMNDFGVNPVFRKKPILLKGM